MNPVQFVRQIVRFQKETLNISYNTSALFEDQAESLITNMTPPDHQGFVKTFFKAHKENRDLIRRSIEAAYDLEESMLAAFDGE